MTKVFAGAIPSLTERTTGQLPGQYQDADKEPTPQDTTALIVKNHASLREDLAILTKLMHIARNLLVTSKPDIPQDISAALQFDQMVCQTIVLCTTVTSKGCDGEAKDDAQKARLAEIVESCKDTMPNLRHLSTHPSVSASLHPPPCMLVLTTSQTKSSWSLPCSRRTTG